MNFTQDKWIYVFIACAALGWITFYYSMESKRKPSPCTETPPSQNWEIIQPDIARTSNSMNPFSPIINQQPERNEYEPCLRWTVSNVQPAEIQTLGEEIAPFVIRTNNKTHPEYGTLQNFWTLDTIKSSYGETTSVKYQFRSAGTFITSQSIEKSNDSISLSYTVYRIKKP